MLHDISKVNFYEVQERNTFLNLTYEEELSILYHMGGLDTSEDKITVKNVVEAFHKSTLSLLLHQADAYCTYIVEGPLNNE